MPNTAVTATDWQDETTLAEIPDFEACPPELVAARDRYESAELEFYAWLRMAGGARYGVMGARMEADDRLSESMDAPDNEELRGESARCEARLAREQRSAAIVHARGRAARQELDEAAIAWRDLLVAAAAEGNSPRS